MLPCGCKTEFKKILKKRQNENGAVFLVTSVSLRTTSTYTYMNKLFKGT